MNAFYSKNQETVLSDLLVWLKIPERQTKRKVARNPLSKTSKFKEIQDKKQGKEKQRLKEKLKGVNGQGWLKHCRKNIVLYLHL